MMAVFTTTIGRIFLLFLFIFAGFILVKLKALPKNASETLSKLENNLFIPALVLSTFSTNFTKDKITTAWRLLLVSSLVCALMILVSTIIVRFVSKDRFIRNIYTYGLVFSNFGFMGNAVISVVFPAYFLEYLIFTLPLWTMIYLWGVPCLLIDSEGTKKGIKSRLMAFVNPMFIAMIIGMVIGLTGIQMPEFISSAVSTAGDCMSPVAMILTGVIVASMELGKVLKTPSIYIVSFIRLLVIPLIAIAVFMFVKVPATYVVCTVSSLAMPLGLNIMVIPSAYGKDTSVPAGAIIVSHLISGITIPFIFYLMLNAAVVF